VRWPKRFALHEAASSKPGSGPFQMDVIQAHGDCFVAVDGPGMAIVPILGVKERSGADLPRLEPGEDPPRGVLPPKAFQEAAQGVSGWGRLVVVAQNAVEAQRSPEKPWMRFERPVQGDLPPIQQVIDTVDGKAPLGARYVEVCLDAEVLVRLSRAIGANEAVRLRFLVDNDGKCRGSGEAHGFIDIRDARDNDARAILGAFLA
jgi:hypothetical protein